MAAKYLFCLPLRFGVLLISFFQFLASGAITGLLTYGLILNAQDKLAFELTSRMRTSVIVLAAICGLVAIISLTGFIGAIRKSPSAVGAFRNLLWLFFVLELAAAITYFVLYFADKDEFKKLCIEGLERISTGTTHPTSPQDAADSCDGTLKRSLAPMIVSAVVPLLSQAYGVYIVSAYARKLREEPGARVFRGPGYAEIGEEARPLTHKGAGAYADV
ncbi:hypothetical protein B0H17DRAFT_378028 [Mycena rosella]|uniref:Tetraspanin n=1 Tax=Mycena rosella TaxID=1033263 RepID=A0AAD7G4G0_MYCRO|nr:hypothetical protein B0H17DRAFT_378028 [Mycena rosella]